MNEKAEQTNGAAGGDSVRALIRELTREAIAVGRGGGLLVAVKALVRAGESSAADLVRAIYDREFATSDAAVDAVADAVAVRDLRTYLVIPDRPSSGGA